MMRKLLLIMMLMSTWSSLYAQFESTIMSNVLSGFKNTRYISADFEISSSQFQIKGSIVMSGVKFRILTNDFKSWYDGKTQWIYTTATNEVNILEPTEDDLKASNPYLAVMDYNANYDAAKKSIGKKECIIELKAKNGNMDISKIELLIDVNTYRICKAVVTMAEGETQVIKLGSYVIDKKVTDTTFTFDEKMVPKGTLMIDLR